MNNSDSKEIIDYLFASLLGWFFKLNDVHETFSSSTDSSSPIE